MGGSEGRDPTPNASHLALPNGQDFCCASRYFPERLWREAYLLIALQQIQVGVRVPLSSSVL